MTHDEVIKTVIKLFDGKVIGTYDANQSSKATNQESSNQRKPSSIHSADDKSVLQHSFKLFS